MAESAQCRLLGGFFSTFIQGCLAFLCIGTLIIKRQNEVPRRDWYVWFLDVMKQGIGSSFGHFSNIFLSVVIADSLPNADECQWYCLTYVVDSTIGTTLNLAFLHCFEKAIARFPACGTMDFGDYGDPPSLKIWGGQLAVWLTIVVLGKIIILTVLFHFLKPIDSAMQSVFSVFKNEPELELVMVMIIIPTILNTVQFWVTDTFLKKKEEIHTTLSDNDLDEDLISEELPDYTKQLMGARVRNRTGHSAVREVGSDGIGGVDGRRGRKNSGSSSYLHRLYQNSYFPNWWARMTGGSIPFTSVVHKQSPSSALADADYDEEQMEATGATSLYPHSSRKNAGASYSVVNGLDSDTVYSPVNSGSGEETTSRMASSGESQIHLTDVSHRSRSFFSGSKPAGSSSADSIGNLSPTRRERIAKGEKTKLNRSSTNNSSNTGTFTIDTPTEEAEDDVYL